MAGGRCHGRRSGGTGGQRAGRGGDAHVGASRHVHLGVRGEVRNALGRRALRKCHSCFDVAAAIISFHFITGRKRLKRMWLLAGIYIYIYIFTGIAAYLIIITLIHTISITSITVLKHTYSQNAIFLILFLQQANLTEIQTMLHSHYTYRFRQYHHCSYYRHLYIITYNATTCNNRLLT